MQLTGEEMDQLASLCFEKAARMRGYGKLYPKYLIAMEARAQFFEYLAYRLLQRQ